MGAAKNVFLILVLGIMFPKHATCTNSALFKTRENTRLNGHVVKQFQSPSFMSCNHWCLRNSWCTSTNFRELSEVNKKGTCELNKHGYVDQNTNLDDQKGVTFSLLVKGHHLRCAAGLTGPLCEYGLGYSAILANDGGYLRTLNNWLSPVVQSQSSYWKRCWRASVDGWASTTFHSLCDSKGPTVTIIRVGKYIFGGYTGTSWTSSCGYRYTSSGFLFSLVNKPGWAPVKLPQTGRYSSHRTSIYSCSSYGPTFGGGHDFRIASYASSNNNSQSNPGHTYSLPSGHSYGSYFSRSFLAGSYNHFQPDEVEVFYEST